MKQFSMNIGGSGGGGTGDVTGPGSSTDNAVARFDGTTGKIIQNSVVTISDTGVMAGASISTSNNTITGVATASFTTIQTDAGSSPVADSVTDTLTLTSTGIVITGDSTTDTVTFSLSANNQAEAIDTAMQGNGDVLTTGILVGADWRAPFNMTITGWYLFADQTGSLVVDVWKDTFANYPPTVADTITAAAKPTLSSAITNSNTSLGTWTTSISTGDVLRFNIDSCSTITYAVLQLVGVRT